MRYVLGSRASIGGVLGSGRGGAAAWYLAGGVSAANCVAAYAPKGAASLAASYTNLANPGTYDCTTTSAPSFATATGWYAFGSGKLLTVAVSIESTWTVIIRQTATGNGGGGFGRAWSARGDTHLCYSRDSAIGRVYVNGGVLRTGANIATDCTLAIASNAAYFNGSSDGTISGGSLSAGNLYIGNRAAGDRWLEGSIAAFVIYNVQLTAPQVAAISSAMSAL